MASLYSEQRGRRTLYRIQYRDGNKRRKSIRLGSLPKKAAEHVRAKVEALVSARIAGSALDNDTSRWLANLGDDLRAKLSNAGLCEARVQAQLGPFLSDYITKRTGVADCTKENWRTAADSLVAFFGEDKDLRTIASGDAEDWRETLALPKYAIATQGKYVKYARQMFRYASGKGFVESNPFQGIRGGRQDNPDRQPTVSRETFAQVMAFAPDTHWRCALALLRLGGLRVCELSVRWQDVDWERQRFAIRSSKTGDRVCPIFPPLLPFLQDAWDLTPEGAEYVLPARHRDRQALRGGCIKMIKQAAVKQWEQLFHALRRSRQTELESSHPTHVVCAWLGNSPATARRHYLVVTEDHFAKAVTEVAQGVVQRVVHHPSATTGNRLHPVTDSRGITLDSAQKGTSEAVHQGLHMIDRGQGIADRDA